MANLVYRTSPKIGKRMKANFDNNIMEVGTVDNVNGSTIPQCGLSRPLGDCTLRRAGCGSLYDVLCHLYPPQTLLIELRSRQDLDPSVAQWLKRLEAVKPTGYRMMR